MRSAVVVEIPAWLKIGYEFALDSPCHAGAIGWFLVPKSAAQQGSGFASLGKSWIGHAIQALRKLSILGCEISVGGCNSGWDGQFAGICQDLPGDRALRKIST